MSLNDVEKGEGNSIPIVLEIKRDERTDVEKATSSDSDDSQDVTWTSSQDPTNPLNWPKRLKLTIAVIISLGGLVSLMSSSMMAPALPQISHDLHLGVSATNMTLSIYILALAFGPLIISPMSEMFGQKWVYLGCHAWYIFWNAMCPVGKERGVLILGRFMAGLGSSVALALPGPIMSDIFPPSQRGLSYGIVTFFPLLGVAVGPIAGGFITSSLDWPWLFWIVSSWDFLLFIIGIFLIHESYEPTLLARKAKKLRKETGRHYVTRIERTHPTLGKKLRVTMVRPFKMFVTQPIVPILSLYLAYHFGVYCLTISTFAEVWTQKYGQSVSSSGLHYIAIGTGAGLASQIGGLATDRVWKYLKAKKGGEVTPEYRVPMMIPGAVITPIGLFWYGWTIQHHAFWLLPDFGILVFGFGVTLSQGAAINYVVEIFGQQSASALAAVRVLSNIFGFAFPLFAAQLYVALGYGWGNSLLAFLFLAMGIPAPILLWRFGGRIRGAGKMRL